MHTPLDLTPHLRKFEGLGSDLEIPFNLKATTASERSCIMSNQEISEDMRLSHVKKLPFMHRPRRRMRILSASFSLILFEINLRLDLGGALTKFTGEVCEDVRFPV